MDTSDRDEVREDLQTRLPANLLPYLDLRDGAAAFLEKLPEFIPLETIADEKQGQRTWELVGLFYRNRRQFHAALAIFSGLYEQTMIWQEKNNQRLHKGMPLVWISDCYVSLGLVVHGKRYLMLALCEDSITTQAKIDPERTGVYFRLVWGYGLSDAELKRYSEEIYNLSRSNPTDSRYPEWVLQELDQNWMTAIPEPSEAAIYSANTHYVNYLLRQLGEPTGRTLERLAEYVLSCMPGCRTLRRMRSNSTDYDIVCSMEGLDLDFRSELGRYFVCECKDWDRAADFSTMAKFCRVLDSTKSRFGILFSKSGISGIGKTLDAEREQLKIFQDRAMVIVVVNQKDLEEIAKGINFVSLLRSKYEIVRLDIAGSTLDPKKRSLKADKRGFLGAIDTTEKLNNG